MPLRVTCSLYLYSDTQCKYKVRLLGEIRIPENKTIHFEDKDLLSALDPGVCFILFQSVKWGFSWTFQELPCLACLLPNLFVHHIIIWTIWAHITYLHKFLGFQYSPEENSKFTLVTVIIQVLDEPGCPYRICLILVLCSLSILPIGSWHHWSTQNILSGYLLWILFFFYASASQTMTYKQSLQNADFNWIGLSSNILRTLW